VKAPSGFVLEEIVFRLKPDDEFIRAEFSEPETKSS